MPPTQDDIAFSLSVGQLSDLARKLSWIYFWRTVHAEAFEMRQNGVGMLCLCLTVV